MHLDLILISSFLFTSVSLAGFAQSQRPALRTRDKSPSYTVKTDTLAGATIQLDNGTINTVFGTITVPQISGPADRHFALVVGLDSFFCNDGYLRCGIDATMTPHGPEYKAFYTTLAGNHSFDLSVSAGDRVTVIINTISDRSGWIMVQNHETGKHDYWTGDLDKALCQAEANWLLYLPSGQHFPELDMVHITRAVTMGPHGQHDLAQDANYDLEIVDSYHTTLTSVTTDEDSVTIKVL